MLLIAYPNNEITHHIITVHIHKGSRGSQRERESERDKDDQRERMDERRETEKSEREGERTCASTAAATREWREGWSWP